jgi:hypothetical protein
MRRYFSFEAFLGVLVLSMLVSVAPAARADVCSISAVTPAHGAFAIGMVVVGAVLLVVQRMRRPSSPHRPE